MWNMGNSAAQEFSTGTVQLQQCSPASVLAAAAAAGPGRKSAALLPLRSRLCAERPACTHHPTRARQRATAAEQMQVLAQQVLAATQPVWMRMMPAQRCSWQHCDVLWMKQRRTRWVHCPVQQQEPTPVYNCGVLGLERVPLACSARWSCAPWHWRPC
jgi:hypothetical protein